MENPIPSQITQVKTMARAVRITVDTNELLTPPQIGELFALYEKVGWFFFLESPEARIDTSTLPAIRLEAGERSPSERLRSVLFVFWDQNVRGKKELSPGGPTVDFEIFYRQQIKRYIDSIKQKLT